jgi:putative IMPACT (imprinted ancient) family translation regulator
MYNAFKSIHASVCFSGSRMLHLLDILNVENVMVVVSRWYGGIQLGPDRFKVNPFTITNFYAVCLFDIHVSL